MTTGSDGPGRKVNDAPTGELARLQLANAAWVGADHTARECRRRSDICTLSRGRRPALRGGDVYDDWGLSRVYYVRGAELLALCYPI